MNHDHSVSARPSPGASSPVPGAQERRVATTTPVTSRWAAVRARVTGLLQVGRLVGSGCSGVPESSLSLWTVVGRGARGGPVSATVVGGNAAAVHGRR